MRGLIVVNQSIGHNQYKIDRFLEESRDLGIDLDVVINDGHLAKIENGEIVLSIPKYDFVLYLDKDIYGARILERQGYRLFNKADFIKLCDDKMLTLIRCANEGFPIIKTLPAPLVYVDELSESNYKFLDHVVEELGLPLVAKRVYGSLGEGVYLIDTKDKLREFYKENYRGPLLFEEYVKSSKGRSLRALVIDNKVIGIIERNNPSDFRSNYGTTNFSLNYSGNKKCWDFAEKISQKLNIEYAGIDFLYDENGDPILCEINSNAFFEEFEKTTHINVAKLFLEMVKNKVSNEQK
ncbi:MAG: RimK family alpha-L-glutamate ligase [Erysipelotrichaceae bacterium]|nr:RimK family alpha-L-glutamate ligase [Erysipelotrichaceae bacterium]